MNINNVLADLIILNKLLTLLPTPEREIAKAILKDLSEQIELDEQVAEILSSLQNTNLRFSHSTHISIEDILNPIIEEYISPYQSSQTTK